MIPENQSLMAHLGYNLRVIWACMLKDIRVTLRNPVANIIVVLLPINFLILELLFAISGGQAPTAVVMEDKGPYAQQFLEAMRNAHSFTLEPPDGATAEEAKHLIETGNIVAVVTIPASFDDDLKAGRSVTLPVVLNNLNVDFTNDIRRALPLTITSFYASQFPNKVVIQAKEEDLYTTPDGKPSDTGYIPYLAVSIVVVSLILGSLIQSGNNAAIEYERSTIKELLLSPASRWALQIGKVLGALVVNTMSTLLILFVVVALLGVHPVNWLEVIGAAIIVMPIFGALGTLAGTVLRNRRAVIPLSLGLMLPLFFLSGPFGPVTFGPALNALISKISPAYYGISVFQHAFHGFITTSSGPAVDLIVLLGFAVGAILVSTLVLRRTSLSH